MKRSNIHIIRVAGQKRKMRLKQVLEKIMTENFTNLMKNKGYGIKKLSNPNGINPKTSMPKHIIIKPQN